MEYEKKLAYQSNFWYNDGLRRAKIRDLSGAIASLRRSLQYNTANVAARNLLGLVYYGRGEVVEALVEWILSKNFQSEDNIANYYIEKIQEIPGELEKINEAVKRYNQCIEIASQRTVDIAIARLKKVLQVHPSFVKAYQLLAFLYIYTEQYTEARKLLRIAHKIDTTDALTLRYMHEISEIRKARPSKAKVSRDAQGNSLDVGQTITYNIGNESIIQPTSQNVKEHTRMHTILNVLTGMLVGVAVMWFLIMPAITHHRQKENNEQVVEFSDQIAKQDAQISALKKELEGYRATDDAGVVGESETITADTAKESYEIVMKVYDQFKAGETSDKDMVDQLVKVTKGTLGERGKKMFKTVTDKVYPRYGKRIYESANNNLDSGNLANAITDLSTLVAMNESYDKGKAILKLAEAYEKNGETQKAVETYKKITLTIKNTSITEKATEALTKLNAANTANGAGAASKDGEN